MRLVSRYNLLNVKLSYFRRFFCCDQLTSSIQHNGIKKMVVKVVHPKCVIKFQQPNFSNLQAKLSLYRINKKFTKVGFVNLLVKFMKKNR